MTKYDYQDKFNKKFKHSGYKIFPVSDSQTIIALCKDRLIAEEIVGLLNAKHDGKDS